MSTRRERDSRIRVVKLVNRLLSMSEIRKRLPGILVMREASPMDFIERLAANFLEVGQVFDIEFFFTVNKRRRRRDGSCQLVGKRRSTVRSEECFIEYGM